MGRATALMLAEKGADVAVLARSADEIEAVAGEVRSLGRRSVSILCDVTACDACKSAVDQAVAEFGRLDILVNNAGGGHAPGERVADSDPARWASTIALNLLGVYYVTHAALPHLIAAGGSKIVNVGSGVRRMASTEAYAAAKAGVWVFTQGLAMEVWEYGIDVNEVIPGPVATRLSESIFTMNGPPPAAPSERVKGPEEPAELILWLVRQPRGGPTGQSFSLARRPLG